MRPLQRKVSEYEENEKELESEIEQCKHAIEHALSKVRPNCRLAAFRDRLEDDDMNTFTAQDEEMQKFEGALLETKTDMEKNSQVCFCVCLCGCGGWCVCLCVCLCVCGGVGGFVCGCGGGGGFGYVMIPSDDSSLS